MRNKALIVIGALLFLLCQVGVNYLIYKYKNNIELPKVELKDMKEEKVDSQVSSFALMLEQSDGTYTASDSNDWPGIGYFFNSELSGCIDTYGNTVDGILTFDDDFKVATLKTDGTVYCYLYFKAVAPSSESILINDDDTYTNSTSVTLTLSASDVTEMCISNTTDCSEWEEYSTSKSWTLSTGDGTKTVYVTYRNESNKEIQSTDTIILDTTPPNAPTVVVTSGTLGSNGYYTDTATVTCTAGSDVTSGAEQVYWVQTGTWEGSSSTTDGLTTRTLTVGSDGARYIEAWTRDKAGNISESTKLTVNKDGTAPTLTVSAPAGTSSSSPTNTTSSSYTVSGTVSDATSGVSSVTVNGSAATISGTSWSKAITLSEGTTTTVTVVATDKAGKTTTVTRYVRLDTTAPTLTVTAPTGTSSSSPTISTTASYTVKGTVSDASSGVKSVTVNGTSATISGTSWSLAITLTAGSTTTVKVIATDNVGKTTTITRYVMYGTNASSLVTSASLWSSGLSGDGYRYTGSNPNNYICFGTTTKSTCTGNTDAYMYRIIGVFTDSSGNSYMKLIKKEALNTAYAWNSSIYTEPYWGSMELYTGLNGSYYLSNTTYMPSGWSDRIATWSWTATNTLTKYSDSTTSNTGTNYYNSTGAGIYNSEHQVNTTTGCYNSSTSVNCYSTAAYTTVSAKIGLMYASDYVLAGGSNYLSQINSAIYSSLKSDSWMYLSNSDSGAPHSSEWTMTSYGLSPSYARAWYESSAGDITFSAIKDKYSVRPVFYLTSSQVIASGTGTSSDPYILS